MKKLLILLAVTFAVAFAFSACSNAPEAPAEKEDVITVEDGYLVVNGVKTDYQVKTDDVIEVVGGYVTVNGVKTQYKVDTPDVIEVIDGYVYVNGVKTDIYVPTCNHSWTTVTTAPTCSAGGYDTKTCSLCGKSVKDNETAKLDHNYATTYSFDDNNHWFDCTGCDAKKDEAAHTPDADGICTVCQTPISATPGVIYDISADGTYAEVIGYEGTATKVKIASEYKGLPVTNIYDGAFKNNKTITYVIIPDSVTNIGNSAFYFCKNISSVAIPNSVTNIGNYAFCGTGIETLIIPDSVTIIGDAAFSGGSMGESNDALKSVVIGGGVTEMGWYAFKSCINLCSLVITDGTTVIGRESFRDCTSLTSVVIPDSVTNIEKGAFYGCSSISSVSIGDGVTSVGENAFSNCNSALYTEENGLRYVGNINNPYAILIEATNKNLSSYTIHEDTQVVAYGAFKNCSRLTSITIPNGVKAIGDWAFDACQALTSIVIPDSVVRIGVEAFGTCYNLDNVYYTGNESDWDRIIVGGINTPLTNATIHYNYVPTP